MSSTCKNNCIEDYIDKCVIYTGPSFPPANIETGSTYDKVLVALLQQLQDITEQKLELKCLYDNTCGACESEVTLPEAVEILISKICTLSSSEITYKGQHYCIGNSSISPGAIHVLGKTFTYSVQPALTGTSIVYDLTEVINKLPSNFRVGRVNSVVAGQPKRGKTVIADSTKNTVGVTVDNDRFPVYIDIDMRVITPSGDVKLVKRLSIPTPESGTYVTQMNVQDFGTDLQTQFTLETFIEGLAAQSCASKNEIDSFKNLDLPGCSNLQYTSGDVRDILAQHSAVLCSLIDKINTLQLSSTNTICDGCNS